MAKYIETQKDREDFLILAGLILANKANEKDNIEVKPNQDKFFDITGSLGCWGVAGD